MEVQTARVISLFTPNGRLHLRFRDEVLLDKWRVAIGREMKIVDELVPTLTPQQFQEQFGNIDGPFTALISC